MKRFYPLLLLFTLIWGCTENYDAPCRDTYFQTRLLSNSSLALWPYSIADTLHFVTATNDTLMFYADTLSVVSETVALPINPECPDDSTRNEKRIRTYADTLLVSGFETSISRLHERIEIFHKGKKFTFRFEKLNHPDSVFAGEMEWLGTRFENVYLDVNMGDSVYYTTSQGIIRLNNLTRIP